MSYKKENHELSLGHNLPVLQVNMDGANMNEKAEFC